MEDSRRCDICNIVVHRASYAKHWRSKQHLENEKQKDLIIPKSLLRKEQPPIKKIYI